MIVAVVGKGRNATPAALDQARVAGRSVASLGHVLVTGGLGGCMLAAAEAAAEWPGAQIIGLTPQGRDADPSFPGLVVPTGVTEPIRNVIIGSCCAAMIACFGSHGTLQELAVAIDRGIPVATLDPCWQHLGAILLDDRDALIRWLRLIG